MTDGKIVNYGHSVYGRLLAYSKSRGLDFTFMLFRYAMERLLYRIGKSSYSKHFVLKGATLFLVWKGHNYRVTKDADFLGIGIYDETMLTGIFREICGMTGCHEDGMVFYPDTVKTEKIREDQFYGGIRITLLASLHNARIPLRLDIGYGDAVSPPPEDIVFPTILEAAAPHLKAYTRYTVIAEKFNAMVELGPINSRLKDFYDIWLLSQLFEFDGVTLCQSVHDTFEMRKTPLPQSTPHAFTTEFYLDNQRLVQWKAFIRKSRAEFTQNGFPEIVSALSVFLLPVVDSLRSGSEFQSSWKQGGPWHQSKEIKPSEGEKGDGGT